MAEASDFFDLFRTLARASLAGDDLNVFLAQVGELEASATGDETVAPPAPTDTAATFGGPDETGTGRGGEVTPPAPATFSGDSTAPPADGGAGAGAGAGAIV